MWIVAGLLLGVVILAAVAGFHAGPHAHVAAGVAGALAAVWLIVMALSGRSGTLLWTLFGADLVISAGLGIMAWAGIVSERKMAASRVRVGRLEGAEGVAVSDLSPEGIVRVNGEQWSAVCVNGTARATSRVQVIRSGGVRLEVWGEEAELGAGGGPAGTGQESEGKSS